MGIVDHKEHAAVSLEKLRCAVIIVSDSRTLKTDQSGSAIKELLLQAGHEVPFLELIKNEVKDIQDALNQMLDQGIHCILFTGGTGMGKKDITIETVSPFVEKRMEGFGELFRTLSYEQIGSAAMMSRALAGRVKDSLVVCLPGSKDAVELGMNLLIPELKHILWVITK